MNLKKLERFLRINLLGLGPRLMKNNLPGRGLTKVEKHWFRRHKSLSHHDIYFRNIHSNFLQGDTKTLQNV